MTVTVKRIYDEATPHDGYRVLVDRLWPRGVSKEAADLGEWVKEAGPSSELRNWFHHDPERFDEFEKRYRAELDANPAVETLQAILAEHPVVTLLYSARDTEHNQAVVLRDYLTG